MALWNMTSAFARPTIRQLSGRLSSCRTAMNETLTETAEQRLNLTAYFDETGHADDPALAFAGMAGFVAPRGAWVNFEAHWQDALKNAGLNEPFHMREFAHSIGQFRNWKGKEELRRRFLGRLLEIILETGAKPIGAVVSLRDFETLTEAQQLQFKNPYFVCFQTCTRGAAIRAVFEHPGETVDMVYALNTEFGTNREGLAERLWQAIKENYEHRNRMGAYCSSTPAEKCPLQAADLFAYELCHEFENQINRPTDSMRWALGQILRMYRIPLPQIRLFDRKELLRMIEESRFPDQTGVEDISRGQVRSAQERMLKWVMERGPVSETRNM